jgi:hypothetical protein
MDEKPPACNPGRAGPAFSIPVSIIDGNFEHCGVDVAAMISPENRAYI